MLNICVDASLVEISSFLQKIMWEVYDAASNAKRQQKTFRQLIYFNQKSSGQVKSDDAEIRVFGLL